MNRETLLTNLKEAKVAYMPDGLEIIGLFGSHARNDATESSDVDVLYRLDVERFLSRYGGFKAYGRIEEIKNDLAQKLQARVDMADIDSLNETGQKYILKDMVRI